MKIIAITLIVGIIILLAKVGYHIYQALCMNFIFETHWPENKTDTCQSKKELSSDSPGIRRKNGNRGTMILLKEQD